MDAEDISGASRPAASPDDGSVPDIRSAYAWLALPPDEFLRKCIQSRYQGSGPGGQKRNRVYSGVRLTHAASGLSAESVASRSSQRNLETALSRLRLRIALSTGLSGSDPAEVAGAAEGMLQREFRANANPEHEAFPGFALRALHHLAWHRGQSAPAAAALGCTASALTRFLKSDKAVWSAARAIREANGLHPLK